MRCDKIVAVAALTLLALSVAASAQNSVPETLVYGKKYVMGTVFEIVAYDRSSKHGSDALAASLQEIVRIDALLSNYKPESALSQLNRSPHLHPQPVPADLYRAIEESVRYSRLTQGKFDISVAPWVDLWKAALAGDSMPSLHQQERARTCIGYEKIELAPPDQITLNSACMTLDLGAIGKGYAVDRAAEVLREWGIHSALINAGGSTILAIGSPPGQPGWRMHLRDPSQKMDPQILLKDQSLSTSEQTPPSLLGKDSAGHIIDPVTGAPLRTDFAVSVVAETGTASDALSTSLLLLGPEKGKVLVNSLQNVSAIWISPEAKTDIVSGGPKIEVRGETSAAGVGNTR